MRVLICNENFDWFYGGHSYMLSIAEQLLKTGHQARIHAPHLGPIAEVAERRGVPVGDWQSLPADCDLVFAQDTPTCLEMWERYPGAVRIFAAHSDIHMLQVPPQVEGAYHAMVVMNERVARWADGLAWTPRVVRLRQPVDLDRFRVTPPRRTAPPRVLVLSNYPFGSRAEVVERACAHTGCELRWVGAPYAPTPHPEDEIAAADAVIGLGRSALDAMAGARAALILGPLGGDGWVTEDNYHALEADGFTGRATRRTMDQQELSSELERWTPELGLTSRELASKHHDVRLHVRELIALARDLDPRPVAPPGVEHELARLVRLEWNRSQTVYDLRRENARLRREIDARAAEQMKLAEAAEYHLAQGRQATAELKQFRATSRYRLAQALGRPIDWLRSVQRSMRS